MSSKDPADEARGAGVPRLPSESTLARSMAAKTNLDKTSKPDPEPTSAKGGGVDAPSRSVTKQDFPATAESKASTAARPTSVGVRRVAPQALRATVQIRRIDPWTTLKVSLVMATAGFFIWMLSVGLLYIVLAGMGVWERLNSAFVDIVSTSSSEGGLISAGQVFGYAGVVGLINVVLLSAFSTIGAFIYNLCADLVGGIQVTLADPD